VPQLDDNVAALKNMKFSLEELYAIEMILSDGKSDKIFGKVKEIPGSNPDDKASSRGDFIKDLANKLDRKK